MLPRLLTAFDSHLHILTLLLVGNAHQFTPLQVITHPSTPFSMASSVDLDKSSGGSFRRLCSVTTCKKKLSLILDLLKLTPLTGTDPDPRGPIAIHDFPVDCRQLPHRKTAASNSQHAHSLQTLSKSKRRPRPDTVEDSDDSQTNSSRPSTNPTGPPAILPQIDASASLLTTPTSTLQPAGSLNPLFTTSYQPPPSLFSPYLWLTFSVHEFQHLQQHLPIVTYTSDMLVQQGMPSSEITECLSYRHFFPRVTQALYPSVRSDNLLGQHYHLTQLPSHVNIDPATGLSPTYQLVIRVDTNYRDFSKIDVQEAAASRFEVMRIPLATRFHEPICAIVDRASTKWLGFLKVDLLNPHTDGLALLQGKCIFMLLLRSEYVVGKIEKGFDFNSTSFSRKIKIQSPILTQYNSRHLLAELICLGYASG
jgi:hypothetical protein